ncbi:putative component of NuA3 histone acetyltransferase complex [Coemansia nantahalensis]|uniref:Component of NuA3 histone acetyltransferase complex n=1 Tax=Coemansia nantahalensis TaxID=2789366 RepID=A0ACC1K0Q9_9FUNG|nr:putative component of NuA3 histone acetyltransferase complex [Coemansia nantahalensis]
MTAAQGAPTAKRARTDAAGGGEAAPLRLAAGYLDDAFTTRFHAAFTGASGDSAVDLEPAADGRGGEITAKPFPVGRLRGVFPAAFLRGLKAELEGMAWHERSNDLYWFHQTNDLALEGQRHVKQLRDYMAGEEFVGFMEKVTGVQLARGRLDMAAQRYKRGNHLLCHDDDVQQGEMTRRIAYIIYLVDDGWSAEDGGALGLFATDGDGYPTRVVARIVPEFNSMGFFLTGQASFHTVEEVTVADEAVERWSVTGWFYGPVAQQDAGCPAAAALAPLPRSLVLPPMDELGPADAEGDAREWARWVGADYLKPAVQSRIQDAFLEQSSVELRDFLQPAVAAAVQAELQATTWTTSHAPAHVRMHLEASPSDGTTLGELCRFLRSASFGRLLEQLTTLAVASASQQLRRFERGHYTLINDQALEPDGLDATLSLVAPNVDWDDAWGGATHYIADKDELLRIHPTANSLSLVLRDEGTLRFVKHVSRAAMAARQDIAMVFQEAD